MNCKQLAYGAVLMSVFAVSGNAAMLITVNDVGSDVVANASGTINTTQLILALQGLTDSFTPMIVPQGALIGGGSPLDIYVGVTGPTSFGSGPQIPFDVVSGNPLGIVGGGAPQAILVPSGYISGSQLTGSGTVYGKSISSLGLDVGTYTWTWGTGASADSLTVIIGVVPEPHQYAMVAGLGLVGVGLWRRHARK